MKKLIYIALAIIVIIGIFFLIPNKKDATVKNDKILIAYFSATGNTRGVAERLASVTNADLFEIVPTEIYTDADLNWRNDKSRSSIEMKNLESRPAIANTVQDMSQYDIIFLGFPIWWGREPSIVDTFVTSYDFSGKAIIPFATSGSTPTTADADARIQTLVPNASVMPGERFPTDVTEQELKAWVGD